MSWRRGVSPPPGTVWGSVHAGPDFTLHRKAHQLYGRTGMAGGGGLAKAGSANIWARMRQPMRAPGARDFYAQVSPVRGPRGKKAKARLLKKGFARRLPHKSTIGPEV